MQNMQSTIGMIGERSATAMSPEKLGIKEKLDSAIARAVNSETIRGLKDNEELKNRIKEVYRELNIEPATNSISEGLSFAAREYNSSTGYPNESILNQKLREVGLEGNEDLAFISYIAELNKLVTEGVVTENELQIFVKEAIAAMRTVQDVSERNELNPISADQQEFTLKSTLNYKLNQVTQEDINKFIQASVELTKEQPVEET